MDLQMEEKYSVDKKHVCACSGTPERKRTRRTKLLAIASLIFCGAIFFFHRHGATQSRTTQTRIDENCLAPLPRYLEKRPPDASSPVMHRAIIKLQRYVNHFYEQSDLDSLSIAVVTPSGSIYEGFWGPLRANETDQSLRGAVDRHSIYRLASLSKLITALQTMKLRDKGVLSL